MRKRELEKLKKAKFYIHADEADGGAYDRGMAMLQELICEAERERREKLDRPRPCSSRRNGGGEG